jgi:hypothetical protein
MSTPGVAPRLELKQNRAPHQRPQRTTFAPLGGGNAHGRVDAAATSGHCRLPKGMLLIASEQASLSLPALEALVLEPGEPLAKSLRSRGNHSRS